jgi:DNA topoisomerase I
MARKGGWKRVGRRRPFRYVNSRGQRITDPEKIARIESLAIPPAWQEVWISPRPTAKLQATGIDSAGRRQYLYHERFRAARDRAKFEKLIRFAEGLPELRATMAEHMDLDTLEPERICATALGLVNHAWFRVGSERAARTARTYGITTLTKRHARVRGHRITFSFRGKGHAQIRAVVVDDELAEAVAELLDLPGGARLFRYRFNGGLCNLTAERLNDYIGEYLGEEFTAKDFRTWGGTLLGAIALAEAGPAKTESEAKRVVAAAMRRVSERLGNTPAVARESYVSPAVVEQYLEGVTVKDFRPPHLRVVHARQIGLDPEEQAVLSLLRSSRKARARRAA